MTSTIVRKIYRHFEKVRPVEESRPQLSAAGDGCWAVLGGVIGDCNSWTDVARLAPAGWRG